MLTSKAVWQKAKKDSKTLGGLFIGYILIVLGVFLLYTWYLSYNACSASHLLSCFTVSKRVFLLH